MGVCPYPGEDYAKTVLLPSFREKQSDDLDRAVIVTVTVMRVMQAAVHQVADMVAMRHWFVATAGAMNVIRIVTKFTGANRSASAGIGR